MSDRVIVPQFLRAESSGVIRTVPRVVGDGAGPQPGGPRKAFKVGHGSSWKAWVWQQLA